MPDDDGDTCRPEEWTPQGVASRPLDAGGYECLGGPLDGERRWLTPGEILACYWAPPADTKDTEGRAVTVRRHAGRALGVCRASTLYSGHYSLSYATLTRPRTGLVWHPMGTQ